MVPPIVTAHGKRQRRHSAKSCCKHCKFRGQASTRELRLRSPCSAAIGAPRSQFVKCAGCKGGVAYVCFTCLSAIAACYQANVAEKASKLRPCIHPVLDALGGSVDFEALGVEATNHDSSQVTSAGGGIIVRRNGGFEWRDNECPLCYDVHFASLPSVLPRVTQLASANVIMSPVFRGTIALLNDYGEEQMRAVRPACVRVAQHSACAHSKAPHPSYQLEPPRPHGDRPVAPHRHGAPLGAIRLRCMLTSWATW